ncbi:MAG: hypothetical protein ACR2RD_11200 [Woeseiaceae bacterium]
MAQQNSAIRLDFSMLRATGVLCVACALQLPVCVLAQDEVDSFSTWLQQGQWNVDARYRLEHVDQDAFVEDSLASTLRLRGGFETGRWNGFSALLEGELVRPIGSDQFNSTVNGRTTYPVIPDPETTEINRALLYYRHGPTHVIAGRQVLPISQERFLGTVEYRQNQQTYDAIMLMNQSIPGWTLVYGYMDRVRRFLSDDNALGDIDMNSHIVNAELITPNEDRLTLYGQFLDMETPAVTAASHRNLGIRYSGSAGSEAFKWLYHAEYADQSSYADGAGFIDADYLRLELGSRFANQWVLRVGAEFLSGDGVYGFQTPFANGHIYHGLADIFALRTPSNGLHDKYLTVEAPVLGARAAVSFHQFDSDNGNIDYGREVDVTVSYRFRQAFEIAFEFSDYDAVNFATDTRRFSLSLRYFL